MRLPFRAVLLIAFSAFSAWSPSVSADPPKKVQFRFKWTIETHFPDKTTSTVTPAAADGRLPMQSTAWRCDYTVTQRKLDDGKQFESIMLSCWHQGLSSLSASTSASCTDADPTGGGKLAVGEDGKNHFFVLSCEKP